MKKLLLELYKIDDLKRMRLLSFLKTVNFERTETEYRQFRIVLQHQIFILGPYLQNKYCFLEPK